MLKIVTVPHPVLAKVAEPVKTVDAEVKKLVREMEKTLAAQKDPQGVGLAAPQVGISLQIFIVQLKPKAAAEAFINPKILETKMTLTKEEIQEEEDEEEALEGCLSIPRIWSPIVRPDEVELEYTDINGAVQKRWFTGFESVVIQHEVDHLNGVLFTQRVLEQGQKLYEERNGKLHLKKI